MSFSDREAAFRDELQAWLAAKMPSASPDGDALLVGGPGQMRAELARLVGSRLAVAG